MIARRPRRRTAFTLIELLVVISIIALLIGLLLPALSKARASGRSMVCLSQLHQIMVATSSFQDENNDYLPMPLKEKNGGNDARFRSNYNHGGRYTALGAWTQYSAPPYQRPLNPYVHPNLPVGDASIPNSEFLKKDKYNFPVFECPEDKNYNYQESWWQNNNVKIGNSAYFTTGTSYLFNLAWIGPGSSGRWTWNYGDVADPYPDSGHTGWNKGAQSFARARMSYPSRFVAYWDDPADFHIIKRESPSLTHHGTPDTHAMTFLDAHAEFVTYDPDKPFSDQHTVLFLDQQKN